jgi:dephospho-CoA kinase
MTRLICITGKKGSGKSVVTGVASQFGIRSMEMHEPVYERMQKEGLELTHENIIKYSEGLRKGGDFAIVAKFVIEKIAKEKIKDDLMVVCGIRHPSEVAEFRKHYQVLLIAVDCDAKIRFERIKARAQAWDSRTFGEFMKKEKSEKAGLGTEQAVLSADVIIRNDGSVAAFEAKARSLFALLANG